MPVTHVLPWIAGLALVAAMLLMARGALPDALRGWVAPAVLAAGFLGFSLVAASVEGPLGFWPEHTRNLWGNQIWFDLLLAIATSWTLILPRARALKMQAGWWLLFIVCTGCVGLVAMLARCLFLEARLPAGARA